MKKLVTNEIIEKIKRLRQEGYSVVRIAERFSISLSTVRKVINDSLNETKEK